MNKRIAKNLAQLKPGTLFVGIDIGKKRHTVSIMTEKAKVVARFKVDNSKVNSQELIAQARQWQRRLGCNATVFGSEPSGHYWKPLAYFLEEQGETFRLVNSFSVKRYREGMDLARTKNDRKDADTIADMLRSGRFLPPSLPYGVHAELRRTWRYYSRLRTERTRKHNLLMAAIDSLFPEFREAFKDILGLTSRAVLDASPSPAVIWQLSPDRLCLISGTCPKSG